MIWRDPQWPWGSLSQVDWQWSSEWGNGSWGAERTYNVFSHLLSDTLQNLTVVLLSDFYPLVVKNQGDITAQPGGFQLPVCKPGPVLQKFPAGP